jgi:hypothetical protein
MPPEWGYKSQGYPHPGESYLFSVEGPSSLGYESEKTNEDYIKILGVGLSRFIVALTFLRILPFKKQREIGSLV